jgi:hypothetical protein
MKFYWLIPLALACCSCANTAFVRAAEPFKALPAGSSPGARQACFERQRVHVLGANLGQIADQGYNNTELLRYYDDSRCGDASVLEAAAQAKIPQAENVAFYGSALGSIAGVVWGGLHAYLNTPNTDFAALDAIPGGALTGWGWGALAGSAAGWLGFAWERHEARELNRQAAGEFNHMARNLLHLELLNRPGSSGAEIQMEY